MKTEPIVVGLNLDGAIATALDLACGATLSSRAGFVRRALVEALRKEGLLPDPKTQMKVAGR
ncbi:hypothetical protein ACUXK4_003968 [Methylorubrum extorquens]